MTKSVINISEKIVLHAYGKDIRRIRYANNLSRQKVCDAMNTEGYVYYTIKLLRYERLRVLTLPPAEMIALVTAIKADFNLIAS